MPRVEIDGVLYIKAPEQNEATPAAEYLFYSSDLDRDITIKGYLKELLATLWREGEGFSGKRPFGNSGWEYDLYAPLIKGGFVGGELDEDGGVNKVDKPAANDLILNIIESL